MSYLGITLFIIFASLVLYLASFVSYHVSRSESLEAGQKRAIYLLAWLLPLIGPAITVAALGDDFAQTKKKDSIPLLSYFFWLACSLQAGMAVKSRVMVTVTMQLGEAMGTFSKCMLISYFSAWGSSSHRIDSTPLRYERT